MTKKAETPPEGPPPVPPPGNWACVGCKFAGRFVDWEDVEGSEEEGETWKGPKKKLTEGFYCAHPGLMDGGAYGVIVGRILCSFKEEV